MTELATQFGQIDIYLFDQLLRGRIAPGMRIFDAGCGTGRNLVQFLRKKYEVFGVDEDLHAIGGMHQLSSMLAPALPRENFRAEPIERMTFPDGFADVVLSSAVLHFARDERQFAAMLKETWRIVKPGGMLFCRLASVIGMEKRMRRVNGRRYLLPDGTERYLVDEPLLLELTRDMRGRLLDPLKTTVVQNQRCMTTWVVAKEAD